MAGEQGLFSAAGYGLRYYKIMKLGYGIQPVYSTGQSATDRAIYFYNSTVDDFVVILAFSSYDDYVNASNWFAQYCSIVGDPSNSTVSPMVVYCPEAGPPPGFLKIGYPQSGMTFGDQVGELVYTMTLGFVGTLDPTPPVESFQLNAASSDPASPYYYPLGTQQGGFSAADQLLYDDNSQNLIEEEASLNHGLSTSGNLPGGGG